MINILKYIIQLFFPKYEILKIDRPIHTEIKIEYKKPICLQNEVRFYPTENPLDSDKIIEDSKQQLLKELSYYIKTKVKESSNSYYLIRNTIIIYGNKED